MQIQRDVYVLRDAVKNPIEYVQGSDAVPIIFTVRDFDIPARATARIYVEKPSTKAIYNDIPGAISGNKITIDVDKQMMAEAGFGAMQVEIQMGEDTLATFEWPLHIKRSLPPIDSVNGSNFLDEYIESLRDLGGSTEAATEEAKEAARKANEAASGANTAAGIANEAAGNASSAATNADAAAGAANEAASGANTAADIANEAADKADNAAQAIQEKADRGDFSSTIEIRNTITGDPGTQASVENIGTEKDLVLDITIPRGATGEMENIDTVDLEFQEADARENIESGETFKTIFGKIKKWFADLKAVAFTASYGDLVDAPQGTNNLLATEPGTWLDAVQGRALMDEITKLNSALQKNESFSCTPATEATSHQQYCFYNPGTRQVHIFATANITTSGSAKAIFTVPEKYRPKSRVECMCSLRLDPNSLSFFVGRGGVNPSGAMTQAITSNVFYLALFQADYFI